MKYSINTVFLQKMAPKYCETNSFKMAETP